MFPKGNYGHLCGCHALEKEGYSDLSRALAYSPGVDTDTRRAKCLSDLSERAGKCGCQKIKSLIKSVSPWTMYPAHSLTNTSHTHGYIPGSRTCDQNDHTWQLAESLEWFLDCGARTIIAGKAKWKLLKLPSLTIIVNALFQSESRD